MRILRNSENLGFLRSCNSAMAQSKGEFIYFLNNDTAVQAGAIDALVDCLDRNPDAGAAGSKLLFENGQLQEAGCIVWADGQAWNYGRGGDPARPEFNYVREVDYCSAASLMVRSNLLRQMGGFDEFFAPAYYEDTDLCFRVRERGKRVLYVPKSVVVHYEGGSHGTDPTTGGKAYQTANRQKFVQRWRLELKHHHFPQGANIVAARDKSLRRKMVLVLDADTPQPDRDGGSRSLVSVLHCLVDLGWKVKYWPNAPQRAPRHAEPLEALGIEVLDERGDRSLSQWLTQNASSLGMVLACRPDIASVNIDALIKSSVPILAYYGHDLHFARMRNYAELIHATWLYDQSVEMEAVERRLWRLVDLAMYPSQEEADLISQMAPKANVRAIQGFYAEIQAAREVPPAAKTLLFVGGFAHSPNQDAAQFLVREILPRLNSMVGSIQVILAGSNPTQEVVALASAAVHVTGQVSEQRLRELYRSCCCGVIPLRFGAGVKGKVVEALGHGLPFVTTTIGAQGIHGLQHIVPVFDDPDELARSLAKLFTDSPAWARQSARQIAFAEQRFSRAAMRASIADALSSVISPVRRHERTSLDPLAPQ